MKPILRYRLLARVAKSAAIDELNKLILDWLDGAKLSDADMKARLADFFNRPDTLKRDDPEYAQILSLASAAYKPRKQLQYHQQLALSDTLYQKALNLFHLKEYKDRGTRAVQVRAVLDDRTTPQCRQMHGRVFDLGTLAAAAPAQVELVRDQAWWEGANYFKGTPTGEIMPSLPPYHYNCRTRIVPYLYDKEYDAFDKLPPKSPIFPTLLMDRLANYDLQPSQLPAIIARASQATWQPGSLQSHYLKHKGNFNPPFTSGRQYNAAAMDMIKDSGSTLCLRIEGKQLILYAMQPVPASRSKAWFFAVLDISSDTVCSFYKNKASDIKSIIQGLTDHKYMIFEPITKSKHQETVMTQDAIDQALAELIELGSIDFYEIAIDVIKTGDTVADAYCASIASHRQETLHVLIRAGLLDAAQRRRIKAVDDFILAHTVPSRLQSLRDWLSKNRLDTD